MTLQSLGSPIAWPGLLNAGNTAPGIGAGGDTLDAAGEYSCFVFYATEDMVISHVGLKLATATGSPTLDIRIETVDAATGVPSGSLWAANTNIVTGALTTTFTLHALTAAATITKGQCFAVKALYNSGTTAVLTNYSGVTPTLSAPYKVTNTTGSAVKASSGGHNWALGSSTTTFYSARNFYPIASIAANAFNNTSSARRGVRFQVPFKAQVCGLRYYSGVVVGDFNAAIFDDAGAELSSSSTAFEGDISSALASAIIEVAFDNAVTLQPATWYRAAIEPASATNCNMYTATLPSLNYRSAWPGGTNFHYTTYVASSWTDTATDQVPIMDLLFKQLDDGVGSGGFVIGG